MGSIEKLIIFFIKSIDKKYNNMYNAIVAT